MEAPRGPLGGRRSRARAWSTSTAPDAPAGAAQRRGRAGPRALHEWRKHVKDLRYGAEVLEVREPAGADSKRSGKRRREQIRRTVKQSRRIAKVARRADRLGEVLGEEHDLMLLAERVRRA